MQKYGFVVARLFDNLETRCFRLVNEIGIKDIELWEGYENGSG